MSIAEKRRGRPPKSEPSVDPDLPQEDYDPRDSWRPRKPEPNGPRCFSCGRPTERSETLLKAYKLVALRCLHCGGAGIEGDEHWYDLTTAAAGAILNRAAIVYEKKNPTKVPPSVGSSRLHDIMFADDERWEVEEL